MYYIFLLSLKDMSAIQSALNVVIRNVLSNIKVADWLSSLDRTFSRKEEMSPWNLARIVNIVTGSWFHFSTVEEKLKIISGEFLLSAIPRESNEGGCREKVSCPSLMLIDSWCARGIERFCENLWHRGRPDGRDKKSMYSELQSIQKLCRRWKNVVKDVV